MSPASVTHGVAKGKQANSPYHIIINYYPSSESNKLLWKQFYPNPNGLKIIEGPQQIEQLQSWIDGILRNNTDLDKRGEVIKKNLISHFNKNNKNTSELINSVISADIEDIFTESSGNLQNSLHDIPQDEINKIMDNIRNSILVDKQWIRLDNLSVSGRLWKFNQIWKFLDKEIFETPNRPNARRTLFIIKMMLINSKSEFDQTVKRHLQKKSYRIDLEALFLKTDETHIDVKLELINIFNLLLNQMDMFFLYWKYWNEMLVKKDKDEFTKSIQIIMNDFKRLSPGYRTEIEQDLIKLSQSADNQISDRAETLYGWLFIN